MVHSQCRKAPCYRDRQRRENDILFNEFSYQKIHRKSMVCKKIVLIESLLYEMINAKDGQNKKQIWNVQHFASKKRAKEDTQ